MENKSDNQLAPLSFEQAYSEFGKLLHGQGSDLSDLNTLQGRAKRKLITQVVASHLILIAEQKGDYRRAQSYKNACYCQSEITTAGDRVYSHGYCKTRICTLCLSIRKANIINSYYPVLSTWERPYFVTLTARSVPKTRLNQRVDDMIKTFQQIIDLCKKRHQRGKGIKIMGIKSLECNFNPKKSTYNPHFHLIVPNSETACILELEWSKKWKGEVNRWKGQNIKRVRNLEYHLVEIIKYGSKLWTEPDALKYKSKTPPMIYAAALDNIIAAFQDRQLFNSFGFNLPPQGKQKIAASLWTNDFEEWTFDPQLHDWVNVNSGEFLTGYSCPTDLEYLLKHNIDTEST